MDDATPMMKLFHKRAGMIRRGRYNARPPMYKALSGEKRKRMKTRFLQKAHKAAAAQAKLDPTDPFVYGRLMAQMDAGAITPSEVPMNRKISV